MGNTIQSNTEDTVVYGGPLEFHEVHASNVELSHAGRRAKRTEGHSGLCFSQRPILPGERIYLKVASVRHSNNNKGTGLRYGYTAVDPASNSSMLNSGQPQNVASQHGFWLKDVSETVTKRSSVLGFCVCTGGEVYYGRNNEEYGILFSGVRTDLPLWMVIDLCGTAASLEFVEVVYNSKPAVSDMTKAARAKFETRRNRLSRSTEALPTSAAEASATDIAARRTSRQTKLFSSARQMSRSSQHAADSGTVAQQDSSAESGERSHRSRRRGQGHRHSLAIELSDERTASSDTSHDVSSSASELQTSVGATRRQVSQSAGHVASDNSNLLSATARLPQDSTMTQNASAGNNISTGQVVRRYRAPAVTMPMAFSSTTGRNICLSEDHKTASRSPGDYCNAYVFGQKPLLPGEEIVVRVTGANPDYRGSLAVGLTACDPTKLKATDLPDDSEKLLDRPEYWVVRKNICSRSKLNDELAFLRTVSGELQYCKNGRRAGTLMHVDCSLALWIFFDIYGTTDKLESLGLVTTGTSARDRDRNASNLSHYNQHVVEWADDNGAAVAAAAVSTSRQSTATSTHQHQLPPTPVSHSASNTQTVNARVPPASTVTSSTSSTGGVSYRYLPATNPAPTPPVRSVQSAGNIPSSGSRQSAGNSNLSLDQIPSNLPPPLIPVPDRYQPLVDLEPRTTDGNKARVPSASYSSATHYKRDDASQLSPKKQGECSVCMEVEPNAALYPCGHMCMCYECALSVQKLRGALCPICRQPIIDILRIYRP